MLAMTFLWGVVPVTGASAFSPNPSSTFNQLFEVEAISANDVWAVGDFDREWDQTSARTLTLHWDGISWERPWSPNPAWDQGLYGVSASSSTDVWAVGGLRRSELGAMRNFAIHWDGLSWRRVPMPNGGPRNNYLEAVEAVSSTDAWAVGSYEDPVTGRSKTLSLHWDGLRWSRVWSPSPGWRGNLLNDVGSTPTGDVLAVGQFVRSGTLHTLALRWNGVSWSRLPSVAGDLWAVSPRSSDDVWAVGNQGAAPLAVHWDGQVWTQVGAPYARDLYGVTSIETGDAWAVGMSYLGTSATVHWDGSSWSRVWSPSPGDIQNELLDLSATSSDDVWAVGRFSGGASGAHRTLVIHWDGVAWSRV
jgi:hypothetical protein